MRDFDEMLRGSFDAHAGEIDRAGGPGVGLAARTVRDVRRKRALRAGATGAAAASAVVGIVATALAFTGDGGAAPAAHKWFIDDPYSLGPCASFIPANAAVLPDGYYVGRAYVDSASGFVVAVTPDGKVTRVQPGPNRDYAFDFGDGHPVPLSSPDLPDGMPPVVEDYVRDGGSGDMWVDANPVGWDWTVEPLAPAPAGVNVDSLYATFAMTLGFGGQGFVPSDVPAGAVAAVVAIYADGHEVTGRLVKDLPAPNMQDDIDSDGLIATAMRVTLADGHVWEIRADYTPEKVPQLRCQPTPPSATQEQGSPAAGMAPQSGEPGASAAPLGSDQQAFGDPLSGPESAVFQCGAPLPADLKDTADVKARIATGDVSLSEPDVFTVGDDGLVVEATAPLWEVDQDSLNTLQVPGWQSWGLGAGTGPFLGHMSLVEVVALQDGVIVAAAGQPVEDWTAGGVGGSNTSYRDTDSSARTQGFISAYNDIHGLLEPCIGAAPGDLDGSQLAVVYGFGPDTDHMTYGWTTVTG